MYSKNEFYFLTLSDLDTNRHTDQIFMKYYRTVAHKPGPIHYILSDLDPRSRSLKI